MGSPLPPLSIEHVRTAPTHRWLDADLARWAAADGDVRSVSWEDIDAWYAEDSHAFRGFAGGRIARVWGMYRYARDYLAARLIEQLPEAGVPIDRTLLLHGAGTLLDFAAVVRISSSRSRGDVGVLGVEGFQRAFENGLFQWIVAATDLDALIAILNTKRGAYLNELAAARLAELPHAILSGPLVQALDRATPLVAQQIISIFGARQITAALPALLQRIAAIDTAPVVRTAAEDAVMAMAIVDPILVVTAVIQWMQTDTDPYNVPAWFLHRVCRDADSTVIAMVAAQIDRAVIAAHNAGDRRQGTALIAVFGEISGPIGLGYLHKYLGDPRYENVVGESVRAIEQNYATWRLAGAPAVAMKVQHRQTVSILDGLLLTEYQSGVVTRAEVVDHLPPALGARSVTIRVCGLPHRDLPTRKALVAALCRLDAAGAADLLAIIAKRDPDPSVRQMAIEVLQSPVQPMRIVTPIPPSDGKQGGPRFPTPPTHSDRDVSPWTIYTTSEGGYEWSAPYDPASTGPDAPALGVMMRTVRAGLAQFGARPSDYSLQVIYAVPQSAAIDLSDDPDVRDEHLTVIDTTYYEDLKTLLQDALMQVEGAVSGIDRFQRYTAVTEESSIGEVRFICTPRSMHTPPSGNRCAYPATAAEFDRVLHEWELVSGGMIDAAHYTVTGVPSDRRITVAPANGASLEDWIAAWQSLATALRTCPCHPVLAGHLTVAMTLPQWARAENFWELQRALVAAFADHPVTLTLLPFHFDPTRWMPRRQAAYAIGDDLRFFPLAPGLRGGLPDPNALADLLEELYQSAGRGHVRLANHDLLIFLDAVDDRYEDAPQDLAAAIQDTVQRAFARFAEQHGDLISAFGLPRHLQITVQMGQAPTWRIFAAAAPPRPQWTPEALQRKYEVMRREY